MQSPAYCSPIRVPEDSGIRLGRHRHYSSVSPFVRAHLALRRLAIAAADTRSQKLSEDVTLALLSDLRRAADARSLA